MRLSARIIPLHVRASCASVHRLTENALSLFFPALCLLCDKPRPEPQRWLCDSCLSALRDNNSRRNACPRCSINRTHRECACDIVWDHPFECIYSVFDFDDAVRRVMHEVKYRGRSTLARDLGAWSAPLIPASFLDGTDMVIPVPLHRLRKQRRGYNQADFLARGFVRGTGRSLSYSDTILRRSRYTFTQTKLDREGRRRNLRNAFAVDPESRERIRGKRLVLVDDVVTTGATTGVCAEALLAAGCASVRVLSLARD